MNQKYIINQSDLIAKPEALNPRYKNRLDFLDNEIFDDNNSSAIFLKLDHMLKNVKTTPLGNKIKQIQDDILVILFVKYERNISEIASEFNLKLSEVSLALIHFFSKIYVDSGKLNSFFHVDDLSTSKVTTQVSQLKLLMSDNSKNLDILKNISFINLADLLEAPGWENIQVTNGRTRSTRTSNKSQYSFKIGKAVLTYFFTILLMLLFLVVLVKVNKANEDRLLTRVNLPSRFFTWLDSSDLKVINSLGAKVDSNNNELLINEVSESEDVWLEDDRFGVESDVVLASLDEIGELELEERQKGQFRDTRFGTKKVYRLMITSTDIIALSAKIGSIMEKFNVSKGGNVEAGSQLPGGLYYNLIVPTENLKSFFSEINQASNLNIYLSKSKMRAPKGSSNVFMWVKKI